MSRTRTATALLIVALVLALWLRPKPVAEDVETNAVPPPSTTSPQSSAAETPPSPRSVNAPPPQPPAPEDPPRSPATGPTQMQAYLLALREGRVTLDASQPIRGDFHRRRGPLTWLPRMWCIRLLDADMNVLAEDTAPAPDEVCLVGDPHVPAIDGTPRATQFAGLQPESMLQVRLPPHPEARWLRVYRIGSLQRADWNTEPAGQLLANIPLP